MELMPDTGTVFLFGLLVGLSGGVCLTYTVLNLKLRSLRRGYDRAHEDARRYFDLWIATLRALSPIPTMRVRNYRVNRICNGSKTKS